MNVQPAIQALSAAGIRLGFLSNLTEAMMEANIKSAGLEGRSEQLLSTDRVQAYKPDPRAYQMGIDAFMLPKQEILFAAFGDSRLARDRPTTRRKAVILTVKGGFLLFK
jgi:2-haloacid dehalogenase